jgi:predicted phosphodiesterase
MWFLTSGRARALVGALAVVGLGTVATIAQSGSLAFAARATGLGGVSTTTASDTPLAAWTELGPGGLQVVRAVMASGTASCPPIHWEIGATSGGGAMALRAPSNGAFNDTVCEYPLPGSATGADVAGMAVPVRKGVIEKVALLGDTGCKEGKQSSSKVKCDPKLWTFGMVANEIAAENPDLIIHLGDIFYRTTACENDKSNGKSGCSAGIDEDFFTPAKPMLAAAPLVMVRGNHEEYGGDCVGWFRYFEPTLKSAVKDCTQTAGNVSCTQAQSQRFSLPYSVMLNPQQALVVLDTSAAPNPPEGGTQAYIDEYSRELNCANQRADQADRPTWLISHVPLWYNAKPKAEGGPPLLEQALLQAGAGGLSSNFQMVISGHLHQFQYLSFDTTKVKEPPQLILGDGGTLMSNPQTKDPPNPIDRRNGVYWERWLAKKQFGYGVIDEQNGGESIKVKLLDGTTYTCTLHLDDLICST